MNAPGSIVTPVTQLPELARLDAFFVAGPSGRFDNDSKSNIPAIWPKLIAALPFEGQIASWDSYGVVSNTNCEDGSFDYLAGVMVLPDCELPAGFSRIWIPPSDYLVFRITLDGTAVHPQVKAALAKIWQELVPASGHRPGKSPDFERYDGEFAPDRPGVVIDYYVPVEPASPAPGLPASPPETAS